jgi:hypothetical protein
MSSINFLDTLKIKPLVTNENENGIKIIIPKRIVEGDETRKTKEEGKKTQILRELVDEGDRAIEIANKIKERRLLGIKKSLKPELVKRETDREREIERERVLEREIVSERVKKSRKTSELSERKKTSVFQSIPTNAVYNLIDRDLIVGDKTLIDRIPLPPREFIRVPNYVMNNRLLFFRFVNDILFKKYKDQLENESEKSKITCGDLASGSSTAGLMLHQQLVRDYLNLITPYRGLLLYHGLGSGKTCSSIAIAEGMKDRKKVIVMLPASLQRNYIEEIKKCGDPIFKRNQYWEWISISQDNEELRKNISMVLSLSEQDIIKQRGVWITDISKPSNIAELNPDELKSLNIQLDIMIKNKYEFINYNGLRKEAFRIITENYTKNIFDNAVVIVDEAHNLISRIVNKIAILKKSDDKKSKKTLQQQTINRGIESTNELSLQIYHMLMMANNCKIVLLTGTPIINYPNEIGILFNILRGYIKTWTFNLRPAPDTNTIIDEKKLKNVIFPTNKILDFINYTSTSQRLVITRNPFGFENVIKEDREDRESQEIKYKYDGVSNIPAKKKDTEGRSYMKERKLITDDEFQQNIINILRANQISATFEEIKYNLALPDKLDEFLFNFIDINNTGRIKNEMKFKKRIMGLTSYFRSAQEELLPRYDKKIDKIVVNIPMSNTQFNVYVDYRKKERKADSNTNMEKPGDIFKQQSSTYRIMSRLACNLTLPERPNPMDYRKVKLIGEATQKEEKEMKDEEKDEEKEIKDEEKEVVKEKIKSTKKKKEVKFVEEDEIREISQKKSKKESKVSERIPSNIEEKSQRTSTQKSSMISTTEEMLSEKMPDLTEDKKEIILRSISDFETEKNLKFEKLDERDKTKMLKLFESYGKKIKKNESMSFSDYYRQLSEKSKSKKGGGIMKLLINGGLNSGDEEEREEEREEEFVVEENLVPNVTEDDIVIEEPDLPNVEKEIEKMTTDNYKIDVQNFMRNLRSNVIKFLSMVPQPDEPNGPLMKYSPKYVEIIKNITSDEHVGLHLLYSQFRNMEGLDIFSMALDVNGFNRFRLSKNSEGNLEVSRDTLESLGNNELCYAMYTGEESSDERELMRKIYNGDWNEIPQNIRGQLKAISDDNMMGQIIKLLMITSAGAEGINLRNTRYVHIMEPYWHPVRVEQVIGRARRICSHDKLPQELQTVQVFVYISVFTKDQLDSEFAKDIIRLDKSTIEPFKPETSDEKLLRTSNIKEAISENILKSVKETSIDCVTYSETNEDKEGLKCLAFNSAKIEEFSYVPSYEEQQQDVDIPLGQIRRSVNFQKMTLKDGRQYMLKTDTNELYDPIDIEQPNPIPLGRLFSVDTIDEDGKKIPSGKTSIQFYKKSSVIDETTR